MSSVIVIGGGAAGMAAAIAAAACGDQVTVLERMDRVGKKILATGNGRCNLMNAGKLRYPGGTAMAEAVLKRCGAADQARFWEHYGLRMRQEEGGRVYPVSGAASTVLDTMRQAQRLLGVTTVTEAEATAIRRTKRGWVVEAGGKSYAADRVIVAGGGCAQPKLGSNGSAYPLLTALGHHLVKARPALTQIMTDVAPIRGLSGIRVKCDLRVTRGDVQRYAESGELLFADYGVTGVCAMQCARYVVPGDMLHIDMTEPMGFHGVKELTRELLRRQRAWGRDASQLDLLTGLCVPKMAIAMCRAAGIEKPAERSADLLNERQLRALAGAFGDLTLVIKGVKGFENAQVTAGGVSADEFDPHTLQSRIAPGIHAAGEVLDVDGDCGGFNLMFAFGSGILAGLNGREMPW